MVAIIALLIAILLPTLQAAREQAKTTVCMSNLKQFAHGFEFYGGDYRRQPPPNRMYVYTSAGTRVYSGTAPDFRDRDWWYYRHMIPRYLPPEKVTGTNSAFFGVFGSDYVIGLTGPIYAKFKADIDFTKHRDRANFLFADSHVESMMKKSVVRPDFFLLDNIDLDASFGPVGNNPISVTFDGTYAYVGGYNGSGQARNVGILKVNAFNPAERSELAAAVQNVNSFRHYHGLVVREGVLYALMDRPNDTLAATNIRAIRVATDTPVETFDGDADSADFAALQRCFTALAGSTSVPVAPECECFDRDNAGVGDGDLDLDDLAAFQACAGGPAVPADTTCDGGP